MAKKVMGPGPKKGFNPNRVLAGKTFGKFLKPGEKSDSYYYEEGVRGGGQGGIKDSKKSLEYKSTPNISGMVKTQRTVVDKKKAAELKAAKMMVGTAATKNKPVLNTKKVVIKAKYPR